MEAAIDELGGDVLDSENGVATSTTNSGAAPSSQDPTGSESTPRHSVSSAGNGEQQPTNNQPPETQGQQTSAPSGSTTGAQDDTDSDPVYQNWRDLMSHYDRTDADPEDSPPEARSNSQDETTQGRVQNENNGDTRSTSPPPPYTPRQDEGDSDGNTAGDEDEDGEEDDVLAPPE
jgi:hypothetical protein